MDWLEEDVEECLLDDIEELGPNIGPYQTEGFKDLEFTIDYVNKTTPGYVEVVFRNGKKVTLQYGDIIDGVYQDRSEGLSITMNNEYYKNNESPKSRVTNDRILFYLTMVGTYE